MPSLIPCPACDRHVRLTERACPFCATALDARRSVPTLPLPGAGTGRLALFTFALGAGLAGCGEPTRSDAMDVPNVYLDVKDARADAPPLDASVPDVRDAARSPVRIELDPDAGFCNLYGLPPAPSPVK